jgi:hypothetical protein
MENGILYFSDNAPFLRHTSFLRYNGWAIRNRHLNTKFLLDAYTLLRDSLCGCCDTETCPQELVRFGNYYNINEVHVTKTLKGMVRRGNRLRSRNNVFCTFCQLNFYSSQSCPCLNRDIDKGDLFERLDEVIFLLKQKLKKEYSS